MQRLVKKNSEQLQYNCSYDKDSWKIIANIYSSQDEVLCQERLLDAIDKDEFKV